MKELGSKAAEFTSGATSLSTFLALAESERVKRAPREGGKTEKVINFITSFARKVNEYSALVDLCISASPEAASLVWSSCKILLEVSKLPCLMAPRGSSLTSLFNRSAWLTQMPWKSFLLPLVASARISAASSDTKTSS